MRPRKSCAEQDVQSRGIADFKYIYTERQAAALGQKTKQGEKGYAFIVGIRFPALFCFLYE